MTVVDPPSPQDAEFMARALVLAARGRFGSFPNPRVGCVVVRDGQVLGEGWHARAGAPHAEVHALRQAGEAARGADVYVSLEPCAHHGRTPPCVDALIAAGVRRVWAAMEDPDPRVAGRGLAHLRQAGIEAHLGPLAEAARLLNRGFVSRMERGRPWVNVKLGASLDGRTAMASGESQWITGEAAREDVQRLRAEAGAILTGVATVLADDPRLTVRDLALRARPPDRIVLDTRARTPATARVWADDGARRFWFTASTGDAPPGVERVVVPADGGRLWLDAVLETLAAREINSVLVEAGPVLAGAMLRQGLADELVVYLAPSLLGSGARGMAELAGVEALADRVRLEFTSVRQVGRDLRLTAVPIMRE